MNVLNTPHTIGAAISARRISASLGGVQVFNDLSIDFPHRRWTSIVGPNGAGKSTLLKVLAGLLVHQGEVRLLGQAMNSLPPKLRAQQLSWLGQNEASADDLIVYDLVMLGRLPHQPWLAPPSVADHVAVEKALRSTHAWDWRARTLDQLSGGERQRVLLARALAVEAEVLLMDEPLANLDPPHQTDWLLMVRGLVAAGRAVLSVLHEISFALQADDMVVMAGGRIVHHGACSDLATHRALEEVFDHCITMRQLDGRWIALPKA